MKLMNHYSDQHCKLLFLVVKYVEINKLLLKLNGNNLVEKGNLYVNSIKKIAICTFEKLHFKLTLKCY